MNGTWIDRHHSTESDRSDLSWCIDTFGPPIPADEWFCYDLSQPRTGVWFYNFILKRFYFTQEEHAMWYTLRWS